MSLKQQQWMCPLQIPLWEIRAEKSCWSWGECGSLFRVLWEGGKPAVLVLQKARGHFGVQMPWPKGDTDGGCEGEVAWGRKFRSLVELSKGGGRTKKIWPTPQPIPRLFPLWFNLSKNKNWFAVPLIVPSRQREVILSSNLESEWEHSRLVRWNISSL